MAIRNLSSIAILVLFEGGMSLRTISRNNAQAYSQVVELNIALVLFGRVRDF